MINDIINEIQNFSSAMSSRVDLSAQNCVASTLTQLESDTQTWISNNESDYNDNREDLIKDSLYAPSTNKSSILLLSVLEVIVDDMWNSDFSTFLSALTTYLQNDADSTETTSQNLCSSFDAIVRNYLQTLENIIAILGNGHTSIESELQKLARQVMTYMRIDNIRKVVDPLSSETINNLTSRDQYVSKSTDGTYSSKQEIVSETTNTITNIKLDICNQIKTEYTNFYNTYQNEISSFLPNSTLQNALNFINSRIDRFDLFKRRLPEV